jgi:hypothetical protein
VAPRELTIRLFAQPRRSNFHPNIVHWQSARDGGLFLSTGATGFDRGLYRSLDARRAFCR